MPSLNQTHRIPASKPSGGGGGYSRVPRGYTIGTLVLLSAIIYVFAAFQLHGQVPQAYLFQYGSLADYDHAHGVSAPRAMQTAARMELFKKYKVLPPLVSMRNATGKFDFGSRKQSWELYYLSHVFPSSVWCILMMLQNIDSIRRKSPRLHRYLGRIALAISSLLTLSGFSLLRLGIAYRTRDWFHIHTLKYRDYPVLFWPSFTSLTDSVGILMVLTGYKLLVHAWKGDYVRHRTWAKLHTYTGFTIPLQRVWLGVMYGIGLALPLLPTNVLEAFHYPTSDQAIYTAELSANALATLLSALTTLWLIYRDFYGTPNRPKPPLVKVE